VLSKRSGIIRNCARAIMPRFFNVESESKQVEAFEAHDRRFMAEMQNID